MCNMRFQLSCLFLTLLNVFFPSRNDLNILKLCVNRVLRYLPLLALIMLYIMSWLSDVFADHVSCFKFHKEGCRKMWLPTLLFYKNFYLFKDARVSMACGYLASLDFIKYYLMVDI